MTRQPPSRIATSPQTLIRVTPTCSTRAASARVTESSLSMAVIRHAPGGRAR
jgi:hypothetical protein